MRPMTYLLLIALTATSTVSCAKKKKKHHDDAIPAAGQTVPPKADDKTTSTDDKKTDTGSTTGPGQQNEDNPGQMGPDGKGGSGGSSGGIDKSGTLTGTWVHCEPFTGGSKGYIYQFNGDGTGLITKAYFTDGDCREQNYSGGVHYADKVWSMSFRTGESCGEGMFKIDRTTRSKDTVDMTYYGAFKFDGNNLLFDTGFNNLMFNSFSTSSPTKRGTSIDTKTVFVRR